MKEYQFRIRKLTRYNKYGNPTDVSYYVQRLKSFLGFKYWKSITHEVFGPNGISNVPTEFKTYGEAEQLCHVMKLGLRADQCVDTVEGYV